MELIDGKVTAATIKGEIRQEVEDRLAQGLPPMANPRKFPAC